MPTIITCRATSAALPYKNTNFHVGLYDILLFTIRVCRLILKQLQGGKITAF